MVLLFTSFLQLHAQDTIGTDDGTIDTTTILADKIKLKVDFTPSTIYRFTLSLSQKISQELMGSPIEATKSVRYTATSEVVSSNGNGTIIKAIYEEIAVDIDMPQGDFRFDSGKDSMSSIITSIVNRPFLIYLDQQGKVVKEEEVFDTKEETLIDQSTALALAGLELLKEYRIAKMLEADLMILPDYPIEIGENWQKNSQQRINDQFNLNNTATYTLESLNEDLAWINLEGVVSSPIDGENSVGSEVNIEGTQSGTIEVERSSGLILSNDMHQEVEGLVKSQDFEVPIKIITDRSITGEKL